MGKELSERKKKILHALVDVYIATGQPVSSADIQKGYMPEVSSATIRAELSALEALGYVDQPHTSAGRVPLKPAYQLYVGDIEQMGAGSAHRCGDRVHQKQVRRQALRGARHLQARGGDHQRRDELHLLLCLQPRREAW